MRRVGGGGEFRMETGWVFLKVPSNHTHTHMYVTSEATFFFPTQTPQTIEKAGRLVWVNLGHDHGRKPEFWTLLLPNPPRPLLPPAVFGNLIHGRANLPFWPFSISGLPF